MNGRKATGVSPSFEPHRRCTNELERPRLLYHGRQSCHVSKVVPPFRTYAPQSGVRKGHHSYQSGFSSSSPTEGQIHQVHPSKKLLATITYNSR
ncbi:hypothetical protein CEXT_613851 [Caerostris extrusa]|uniref:Uncharacterized protein n=1 Tax=Caerostris extrusa TaxID=172846 RepID=A0AAV4NC43_CAEEX|nr:hypothetical protein CEXT_613851 [Caerostris extrusa]